MTAIVNGIQYIGGQAAPNEFIPNQSSTIDGTQTIEKRQGKKIACIEEIAFNMGYINSAELNKLSKSLFNTEYGRYLSNLLIK